MAALSSGPEGEVLVDLLGDVQRGGLSLAGGIDLYAAPLVKRERGVVQDLGMALELPADAFSTPLLVAGPGEDDIAPQRHLELLEQHEHFEVQGGVGQIVRRSPPDQISALFRQPVRRTRPGLPGGRHDVDVGEQE